MRYPKLNSETKKNTLTVSGFDRGINDENGNYATEDNILKECVNMQDKDGVLKTRGGISAKLSTVAPYRVLDDTVYLPFTVTDTCCYVDGKPYNIAYCCTGEISDALIRIFLVDPLGNITSASSIDCHRLDYTTFNIPKNIFFIVGKKMQGEGVFALLERMSNGVPLYQIYEAATGFTNWVNAAGSIYVPTVRINGRGTMYTEASGLSGLNYPEPEKPEELNLLSGAYQCFYTSDGLSSAFRLPYGNLDPYGNFVCRLYTSLDSYVEWTITFDSPTSTRTIDGQQVTMYLDKTLGLVRFYANSENYCIPIMSGCRLNNIMFKARTTDSDFSGQIISSKGYCTLNNRIYVYGNRVNPNCIYCAKSENPLYFPQNSKLFLGNGNSPVTALKVQNGKLIAFKSNETYRIITSENTGVQKESVLPQGIIYSKGDVLTAQTIDSGLGCANPETIRLCGSRLVWLASDGNVYALATTTYGNTTNIYRVSQPLGSRLSEENLNSAFALTKDGQYVLITGKKAFVMNYRVRGFGYSRTYYSADDKLVSPAWFVWEFPEASNYTGCGIIDGNPVIVSAFDNGLSFHLNIFDGEEDTVIFKGEEEDEYYTESYPVSSGFTTKIFNLGSDDRNKSLDGLFVNGESDNLAVLTVSDGNRKVIRHIRLGEDKNSFGMGAVMPVCRGVSVGLYCERPFFVRNLVLKYRLIGDKGQ